MKKLAKYIGIMFIATFFATFLINVNTASADLCSELSQSTGGFFSCGTEDVTTFTQFQGGLQPPSAEGYDPTLTQQTDLRDFVVNAVNFVLGFLGLVAVVMVIYGGFLYVTAAGQEEQTTKGKKSVMYAIIGIVIILISYALVNTVIKGIGKGTDQGIQSTTELAGAAPENLTGDQTQAIQRLFYAAALQVQRAAEDLATSYSHYVDVDDALAQLEAVPYVDRAEQLHTYLGDIKRALRNIETASGELSRTTDAAKYAEDYVDTFLNQSQRQLTDEWTSWWTDNSDDLQYNIDSVLTESGAEGESIWKANLLDFADSVQNVIDDLDALKKQIESSGLVTTSETDFGVAYDRAVNALENLIPIGFEVPTNQKIVDALNALNDLNTVVQNIKFVAAIITSDVNTGNAPLIVNVDALESIRPDYESISEDDIEWDFGDGTVIEGKFATSHIYRETGTYVIKLSIKGDSAKGIASGVAYQQVKVGPPASQINLNTTIGDRFLGYLSYYKDGFLVIDKNRLNVTLTEARDIGITFDASETIGGSQSEQEQQAGETYIQTISWEFGDGSDKIFGEMVANGVQTHYYGEEGTYPVIIEVTDSRGIKDRKVFEVVVDSPAARIDIEPGTTAKINEDITFDGGQSSTDGGQIAGYKWNVSNSQMHYSADETDESFTSSFENPGVYDVSLAVSDNLGNTATDRTQLKIESEPPQAEFSYSIPNPNKPHIYEFDGTKSFDPDGNIQTGTYDYSWSINAVDDDYDFIDPDTGLYDPDGDSKPRMYVKFYRTGNYTVTLEVDDVNEPDSPGVPKVQTVNVKSILDVEFMNTDSSSAAILNQDNEAKVDFVGFSENAVAYEWDFGDGSSPVSGDMVANQTAISHTYTQAGNYDVRLSVFDREDNENSVTRRVVIGEADNPIAAISAKANGVEIYDLSEPIEVNRKTVLTFSAERSLNRDGTGRRLAYQWDFGDTDRSTNKEATHKYSDLSPIDPGYYTVTLKALDQNDLTKTSTATVKVNVIGEIPTLQAFTAVPQQSDLTTPVRVKLDAIGAEDPDGQIVKYLWWYYDEEEPDLTFGHTITQTPQAYITIGTRGKEGDEMSYKFGVELTDQENYTADASDILAENLIPGITVVNGPNDVPLSTFSVDRTSVLVGEPVNFTSGSYDPDGKITSYVWDVEGDGFGDNKATNQSTISYEYKKPYPDGVNVKLKVVDNNYAEAVSKPVKIFVDVNSEDPVAAFTYENIGDNKVQFTSNSTADTEAGAIVDTYSWDFDISSENVGADSNGDGIADNDVDSEEENPVWTYNKPGVYRVKLNIADSFGKSDEVINFVNVIEPTETTAITSSGNLVADFTTTPAPESDGIIYLDGDYGDVSFDFTNSVGQITKYVFDDNIYVDSNDDGRKADDEDYIATKKGIYTTTFNSNEERIKVRLTVFGPNDTFDVKEVEIKFGNPLKQTQANILGNTNIPMMLLNLGLFGIVSLSLYKLSLKEINIKK